MATQQAKETFVVSTGRQSYVETFFDGEGEACEDIVHCQTVSFRTAYGIEYTHRTSFNDDARGLDRARALARRVQTALDIGGIASLDLDHWIDRVIYGSQAYLDSEPDIVQREKDDALMGTY